MEQETKTKTRRENVVAGIVGALLGSLLGVLCTVVISQLGYVASISGLVMAVGALKGYELLGGSLSKKGAVISSVIVLVMTFLAHRLSWAVALMSASGSGLFYCFRVIPALLDLGQLDGAAFWGDLVMLYLFTLLGAVPTIIGGLRSASMPDLPQGTAASPFSAQEGTAAQAEFYPGSIPQMRPLRLSAAGSMFVGLVLGIAVLFAAIGRNGDSFALTLGAMGCIAGAFAMMLIALPSMRRCYDAMTVMVRAGGTVWKVNLTALNAADTYRFTKKNGALRALRWDILTPEEQERAKASILRAVGLLSSGQVMAGSALSLAVQPLTNLAIHSETSWGWKGTYSAAGGKEKKAVIAKAYPGFAPAPGLEPVQGPVPPRWSLLALSLALTAALGLVGGGVGSMLDNAGRPGGAHVENSPPPAQTSTPAPTPTPEVYASITDEQARAQFHVASELGYTQTAVGYIKAPEGMFGHEAYVDVHVPYSDSPEYLEDGYSLRSAAHGMDVAVKITQTSGNAQTVVDLAYDLMGASGMDIYEGGVTETHYFEEYDIAVKQVTYFEENQTLVRVAVLYADYKQDGCYLSAAITYCPEQFDQDYPQLLAELSDAYALNLPELESMDDIGTV